MDTLCLPTTAPASSVAIKESVYFPLPSVRPTEIGTESSAYFVSGVNVTDASASGSPSSLFRFPFVASTPELDAAVESSGLIIVPVNADGADWTRNSAEESTELVLQKLTDQGEKGIVLLHDPFSKSDRRVDHLIRALSDRDYTIVHVVQTPKN